MNALCRDCGERVGAAGFDTCPACLARLRDSYARACEVPRVAQRPDRSRRLDYLAWCKRQPGVCCVCRAQPGSELHHFGQHGIGQKGDDLLVARLCPACHRQAQGKRETHYVRNNLLGAWTMIQADGLALLTAYTREITAKSNESNTGATPAVSTGKSISRQGTETKGHHNGA